MIPALLLIGLVVVLLAWLVTTINNTSQTTTSGRPQTGGRPPFQTEGTLETPSTAVQRTEPGAPFISTAFYRTRQGRDFRFQFQQFSDGFRIYILQTPYDTDGQVIAAPHMLRDTTGPYICWSAAITDYADAKEIAAKWSEAVEGWRATGKGF